MADESENTGREPNLELPSLLGFGRKKKRRQPGDSEPEGSESPGSTNATPEVSSEVSSDAAPDTSSDLPPIAPTTDSDPLAADPVAEPRGGLAPAAEKPKRLPPVPPPVRDRDAEPHAQPDAERDAEPDAKPHAGPDSERDAEPDAIPHAGPDAERDAEPDDIPHAGPDAERDAQPDAIPNAGPDSERDAEPDIGQEAPTQVLRAASSPPPRADPHAGVQTPAASARQATAVPGPVVTVEEPMVSEDERSAPDPARRSSSFTLPAVDPRLAAFLTGAVVGLAAVLLGFGASRGCEIVRGVGSCGRIGAFALLLILAVQVLIGAALLKAWRLSDPVSTSVLGVGVFAVLVMLFLLGALSSLWTLIFIPLLSGLTFALSWWVTTAFAEKDYRS